jgi:hypothetical protein
MKEYCVYEHWFNGKCIYVGSGSDDRPFQLRKSRRNKKWNDIVGDRNLEVTPIVKAVFFNEKDALDYEVYLTKKMQKEYDLANFALGSTRAGKNNGMYGKESVRRKKIKIEFLDRNESIILETLHSAFKYCAENNICSSSTLQRALRNGDTPKLKKEKIKISYFKE